MSLAAKLSTAAPVRPRLHPNLPAAYRRELGRLQEALEADIESTAALEGVRSLIDRIVLTLKGEGGFEIYVAGDIASMLTLGQAAASGATQKGGRAPPGSSADSELFYCSAMVVAGTGNHRKLTTLKVVC